MKRLARNKRGQFVIIAVMLVATMIISIGALLHNAATYYKHEPWEEYSTLIGDIELNTRHILDLSLANYTKTGNLFVLNNSLDRWKSDLANIYPDKGISLSFNLTLGQMSLYGPNLNFEQGLAKNWSLSTSSSAARANFTLELKSVGLSGYKFTAESFLKVQIVSNSSSQKTVQVVVYRENNVTISDLPKTSFKADGIAANVTSGYSQEFGAITYTIHYDSSPIIEVWDQRGICVIAKP